MKILPIIWIFIFLLMNQVASKETEESRLMMAKTTQKSMVECLGEGSTLVFPFFSRLFFGWSVVRPQVEFSYTPTNSEGGVIDAIFGNNSDWSNSEVLPTAEQLNLTAANNRSLLIVPVVGAAVVPFVNLGLRNTSIVLTQQTLTSIFAGLISKWNDPAIVVTNPDLASVDHDILMSVRSDLAGTTFGFTSALHQFDPQVWIWPPSLSFPSEAIARYGDRWLGSNDDAQGSLAILSQVVDTPYSIGYLANSYLILAGFASEGVVHLQDPITGQSVDPFNGLIVAGDNPVLDSPENGGQPSLLNLPIAGAWPISLYSFFLFNIDYSEVRQEKDCARPSETALFLSWLLTNPEARSDGLRIGYIPSPLSIGANISSLLRRITCAGRPLLPVVYIDQRESGVWVAMLAIAMVCCLFPLAIAVGFGVSDWKRATKIGVSFIASTLIGALLLLSAVVVFYLLPTNDAICQLRTWLVGMGYVLLITPVCSKVFWLSLASARSRTLKKTNITLFHTLVPIAISLALQITLLVIWSSADPYSSQTEILDIFTREATYVCRSNNIWLWIGLEIGYFALLIILGFLLSFYATETPFATVREVAWIGFTLYNLLVFMIILIPLLGAFENSEDAQYFEITIGLIFSSVFTLLTLYSQYLASGLISSIPFMRTLTSRSLGSTSQDATELHIS